MSAAREEFLRRSLVAGVASTVVLSLTALTVGVAPAMADPDAVETTVVEVPSQSSGGSDESYGESYDEPAATAEAPVQSQAPAVTVVPQPTQPSVQPQAPAPEPTQAPVPTRSAPQTVAPETVPQETAEPETVAPETAAPQPQPAPATTRRPSTQVTTSQSAPPAEREAAPETTEPDVTTPERTAPESTTADSTPARVTPAPSQAPAADEPSTETETPDTEAPESEAPESEAPESETPDSTSAAPSTDATSATPDTADATESAEPSDVEPVARVIETLKPEVLQAPADDVVLASKAAPVEVNPAPAQVDELAQLSSLIGLDDERDRLAQERRELRDDQRELREDQRQLREDQRDLRAEQRDFDRRVRQWSPDWVQYDEFYRPMIVNPYRDPVRIVYEYQNRPRVVTIPPLQRMVMYVADLAAYSFTAVVLNAVNTAVSTAVGVAVGSFFGGGFIPTIGAIAPPPPPPLFRYDNVPVQVRYSDAVYEPFRVQRIVDVGDDARYGERRVLLDGATPAWGVWKQSASGERMFEVHRTQQYPGLDEPREGPLPGDYRLRLASEEASSTGGGNQTLLITAAVACAVLSLGAVGGAALLGRRRRV
ncbi:hypothetical protein ACWDUN_26565 [Mycobacterium sp. NPDC003323]